MKIKVIISTIIIIFIGAGAYFLFQENSQPQEQYYDLENIDKPYGDKRLVRINPETGKKEIIVDSIINAISKDLLIELFSIGKNKEETEIIRTKFENIDIQQFWEDYSLEKFSFFTDSDRLIFQLTYPTNVTFPSLISFNISTQEFKIMSVNRYYQEGVYQKFLSPNGKFLVVPSEDESKDGSGLSQKIWLLDLENDTGKLIVHLKKNNETLDQKNEGQFHIQWIDNINIEYAVYDQLSSITNKFFIEIRKVKIE